MLTQSAFRFRHDDGSQTAASWRAAAGTSVLWPPGAPIRIRFGVNSTATDATDFQTFYRLNGGSWSQPVTAGSSVVRAVPSVFFTDTAPTTQQLTSGAFVAGATDCFDGYYGSISFAAGQSTELEGVFVLQAGLVVGDTVDIRVAHGNFAALDAYTAVPRLTVSAPSVYQPRDVYESAADTPLGQVARPNLGIVLRP